MLGCFNLSDGGHLIRLMMVRQPVVAAYQQDFPIRA
jgi:hypothetical protein